MNQRLSRKGLALSGFLRARENVLIASYSFVACHFFLDCEHYTESTQSKISMFYDLSRNEERFCMLKT